MSIRAKLLGVLTLILGVGVLSTGAALIVQQTAQNEKLLAEKQLLLTQNAAFALANNLSVAAREVSRLSKLKEIDPGDDDLGPERQLLYSAHEDSVLFKELRILDETGRLTAVQPSGAEPLGQSFGDRHWFEGAKKAHQPFFYTVPERAMVPEAIGVVVPLRHEGAFTGAIQGILDLHDDKVLLPELRHTAGEGEFALVDRDGRIIFPPGATGLAERGWDLAFKELAQARAGARHLHNAGGDFLYAWAPVGIGNWGVAMRWPYGALAAGWKRQIETTALILMVGVLLVGVVAVAFAAYVTRPLLALGEMAVRLGRGEPAGATPSSRRDEIGALFNAFHHMEQEIAARDRKIREDLDEIQKLNASLEERVAARTRELQETQARLLDVERLAAMGKTAAAIAHELKNALNGLAMCVDLVLADTPSTPASMRVRGQIGYEIARLRDVTESLLTFSRAPRLDRVPTDVNALVERALGVLSEQLADGAVTVVRELDGGSIVAPCDGYKLQGVVINLIKNAVEAMTTRPLDLDAVDATPPRDRERTLRVRTRRMEGTREVAIEVQDTGPGLLPEARRRLFEPFFTTKVTGTGLGLATARRIVEAHGGRIELSDVQGGEEGTIVRVRLPEGEALPSAGTAGG